MALSTQYFSPTLTITPIPATPSGFTLTPGDYTGVFTVDTPAYANGANPEYFLLNITCVVSTTYTTELRINDIELVYTVNSGNSFPSNVNIPGYLLVGSLGPPTNTTAGDTTVGRLFVGPDALPSQPPGQVARFGFINSTASSVNAAVIRSEATDTGTTTALNVMSAVSGSTTGTGNAIGMRVAAVLGRGGTPNSIQSLVTVSEITSNFSTLFAAYALTVDMLGVSSAALTGNITNMRGILIGTNPTTAITALSVIGIEVKGSTMGTALTVGVSIDEPASAATHRYALALTGTSGTLRSGITFGTHGVATNPSIYRSANDVLTVNKNLSVLLDMTAAHYYSSATPTIAAGVGAGTGPNISISGSDAGFTVSLTTGTAAANNAAIFTVTFGATWSSAPSVTWCGGNSVTSALTVDAIPFPSSITTTTMTFTSNNSALADSTAYVFRFTVVR